jgi:hypothetical protein
VLKYCYLFNKKITAIKIIYVFLSFCNFLLASVIHIERFRKPVGLRGGLARPPVIHVLKYIYNLCIFIKRLFLLEDYVLLGGIIFY